MIGLLLVTSIALADEPSTYDRLFGAGTTETTTAAPTEGSPWRLVGPAALGLVGLFCAWRLRAGTPSPLAGKPLKVLCRHPLGDRNALVLIEVIDADGERRRLLIGTGTGAPSLVADLGQTPAAITAPSPAEMITDLGEPEPGPVDPPGSFRPGLRRPELDPTRASLVEEVLSERRARQCQGVLG